MTAPILAAGTWPTNGHLIADVAALGYLRDDWRTLDPTWGLGNFWTIWRPRILVGSDLDPTKSPTGCSVDATALPHDPASFEAVVLDPPYKLNGTDAGEGGRYGVDQPATRDDRLRLIAAMVTDAHRVLASGGNLLLRCQDQVEGGRVRWQTHMFTRHAENLGLELVDHLLFMGGRPQPEGRAQHHARRNYSSLLVFTKRHRARAATTAVPGRDDRLDALRRGHQLDLEAAS